MSRFIPVSQQKDQELREKLSKTLFQSPENFVDAYNKGWISKRNEDILSLSTLITEVYLDVKEHKSQFIFISQSEIFIDETLKKLNSWKSVISIKSEIRRLVDRGVLKNDDTVYFTEENSGYIYYEDEEGVEQRHQSAKLFNSLKDVRRILAHAEEHQYSSDENNKVYSVGRILEINDGFVYELHKQIP